LILAYGVIALLVAVPLGALAGYGLAMLIAYYMNATLKGFRFIPTAILVQTLIALLVPLAAGFVPVNSGAIAFKKKIFGGRLSNRHVQGLAVPAHQGQDRIGQLSKVM
jgi:putative ABC transport system permease protein